MGPVGVVGAPSVFNSPVSARLKSACKTISGCVATFKNQQKNDWVGRPGSVSCSHLEQLVDELNLLPNIRTAHPPRLSLPDHVHGLVFQDRSPRSLSSSSTSRNESEYRRDQRTAQRISSGSVCRHLKITGRIAFFMISSGYPPPPTEVETQPVRSNPKNTGNYRSSH